MRHPKSWLAGLVVFLAVASLGRAATLVLRDGRILQGGFTQIAGMTQKQNQDPDASTPIAVIDDGLHRYFFSRRLIRDAQQNQVDAPESFTIKQVTPGGGRTVSVGLMIEAEPFNEFGRRIYSMSTQQGRVDIIQGITRITPKWTRVEALKGFLWDMRIATSSLPRDKLHVILARQIKQDDPHDRLRLVKFLLQAEREQDAKRELDDIRADFPEVAAELEPAVKELTQQSAKRLLAEVHLRSEAGQHQLAVAMLEKFPSEGVAGELLQEVRELLEEYQQRHDQGKATVERIDALLKELNDEPMQRRIEPIRNEIVAELNFNTIDRMATFQQFADDPDLSAQEKLALAISGWLLGPDGAGRQIGQALSAYNVRDIVRQYFNEPIKLSRVKLFAPLESEEGASIEAVARLVAHMKPPVDLPQPLAPGFYKLQVPGLGGEPAVDYFVQLPPEYDPYRRYPTVVTLHAAGISAEAAIDWWAGSPNEKGERTGQAGRNGYIVIAPAWGKEHQVAYEYSAREHAAVLDTLRDACRRFAIDTDRVFLAGHSMGGDAAWDIGLAHPDLWAGVIPIVALGEKYCVHYTENARMLPLYFVSGELDADKSIRNAPELDLYFRRGYDATLAEFRGRGHEHFYEEILSLFDWMGRKRRDFFPAEIQANAMRSRDNFFWWVELEEMPEATLVESYDWPPPRNFRPTSVTAKKLDTNGLTIRTGARRVVVWLTPELVDFSRRVTVSINGERYTGEDVAPSLEVLLEDARTRADRQHPFWARVPSVPQRSVTSN